MSTKCLSQCRQTDTVHLEKLDTLAWRCAGRLNKHLTDNKASRGEVKETKQTEGGWPFQKENLFDLKVTLGSGETTQQLTVPAAAAEDLRLSPSTCIVATICNSRPGV